MSKFKVGDRVTRTSESHSGVIKGEQYKVNSVDKTGTGFFNIETISLEGLCGDFWPDGFELSPLAKDNLVSIELTHEQLLILYSLAASTTGNYITDTYFTLKRKLEKIHGRKVSTPENLRLPTYVLNYECNEKMKNFVKTFFPEPKSVQQIEYDKLQEQIKLLQQQAERLNPSRSN